MDAPYRSAPPSLPFGYRLLRVIMACTVFLVQSQQGTDLKAEDASHGLYSLWFDRPRRRMSAPAPKRPEPDPNEDLTIVYA